MMDYQHPNTSKGQVERLARLYHRKMQHIFGASLTADDLEQEFWMVWQVVRDRFDPTKGFEFSAFLGISLKNRAMALARYHSRRQNLSAESLDREVGGEVHSTVLDLVESDDEPVETSIIKRQERERVLSNIDPRLRKIITLLENPPAELEAQVEGLRAKAAYARSRGLAMREPNELTLGVLSDLVGLSRCVRYRLLEDMQEVLHHD